MKNFFTVLLITLFAFSSVKAQFSMDNLFAGANFGYAAPVGAFKDYANGGFTYNLFAGYKLNDNLRVGFEYNSAYTLAIGDEILDIKVLGLQGYNAKAWYTPLKGKFKPYAALALGVSKFSEPDITIGDVTTFGAKRFGLGANAEVGFAIAGLNISYAFNLAGKTPKEPVIYPSMEEVTVFYQKFAVGYIYNF